MIPFNIWKVVLYNNSRHLAVFCRQTPSLFPIQQWQNITENLIDSFKPLFCKYRSKAIYKTNQMNPHILILLHFISDRG